MTTFERAKKKKEKQNKKKWWVIKTKNYAIPIYLLPLAIFAIPCDKLKKYFYNSTTWSEEKAKKVLDKILPRRLEWNEEEKHYYCYVRKFGWWYSQNNVPLIHRKWVNKFSHKLREYFVEKYEHEYYTKEVLDDYDWHLIIFTEKT